MASLLAHGSLPQQAFPIRMDQWHILHPLSVHSGGSAQVLHLFPFSSPVKGAPLPFILLFVKADYNKTHTE